MKKNSLSVNISKSAYMVTNGKTDDSKTDINFDGGVLEYKAKVVYPGAIIRDAGIIQHDVKNYPYDRSPQ